MITARRLRRTLRNLSSEDPALQEEGLKVLGYLMVVLTSLKPAHFDALAIAQELAVNSHFDQVQRAALSVLLHAAERENPPPMDLGRLIDASQQMPTTMQTWVKNIQAAIEQPPAPSSGPSFS